MSGHLIHRLTPLMNRAWSKWRPPMEMARLAERVEVLCGEEAGRGVGVIMDAGDWDHVTGFYKENSIHLERDRVYGGPNLHRPTIRYHFRNVLASPSGFHVRGGSFAGAGGYYAKALTTRDLITRPQGFYASSAVASRYFGHWLLDALGTALLCSPDEDLYLWSDPAWVHAPEYLKLLNIDPVPSPFVHFERMTFCDDVGQNSNRRARLKQLRSRLHEGPAPNRGGLVYLRRGSTGEAREIVNEADLVRALVGLGFVVVDVRQPLSEILAATLGARLTLSMEGSQCAHLMLSAGDGATHVIINPSDRFNNVFADYLPAFGDRMATIVAKRTGAGYSVNITSLMNLLERLA